MNQCSAFVVILIVFTGNYFKLLNSIVNLTLYYFNLSGCFITRAHLKTRDTLENSTHSQSVLKATIIALEQNGVPLQRFLTLMTTAEQNVHQRLLSVENKVKLLNVSQKPHESYYQSLTFAQVLNLVLKNLRAQGQNALANQIEELAQYIIGLERIKASGVYAGTEMERTLDRNILVNKRKLVDIINSLIQT